MVILSCICETEVRLCLEFELLRAQTYWSFLCQRRAEKKLAHDVMNTFPTQSGIFHDVTMKKRKEKRKKSSRNKMGTHVTVFSQPLNANIIFNKQDLNSISVDWVRDALHGVRFTILYRILQRSNSLQLKRVLKQQVIKCNVKECL